MADYSLAGPPPAAMTDDAWGFFMAAIRDAGPQFPLKRAWRDVRDVARRRGWVWPAYPTVWRRWNALPEASKLAARHGTEEAVKRLAMPIRRAETSIGSLQWASLDGRTLDFFVDFGDGNAVRPVMIALIDAASNHVLGYELGRSENAVATARLIRNVCREHGIFDRLYTDNGSGARAVNPLGVCHHLAIEITFATPKNAKARIAERTFATLSRVIDDRPEFAGAHAGHAPGARPDKAGNAVPLALAEAVIAREIERHNREEGRGGQGARGRSYEQVFRDGLEGRILRKATAQQLHHAGLVYTSASVDRHGRVRVKTWTYGGPDTQAALLPWHGKGQILIGRDPDDFEAPAIAFDDTGRLICKDIQPVRAGAYGSVDGAREAAAHRKAARDAIRQAAEANSYLDDAGFAAALADLLLSDSDDAPPPPATVVGGRAGPLPLRSARLVGAEAGGAITLVAAAPGAGKTRALMHFAHEMRKDARWRTAVKGEDDTPWGAAIQPMQNLAIGVPNSRNLRASREEIAEAIGVDGLPIIDEAQTLIHRNPRGGTGWSRLEWVRAMSEEGCFSIVFSGDLALLEIQHRLPQLWRRMIRRVIIKAVSKADVECLSAWRGVSDARIDELLYQVARRGGGLADVDDAISHARLLAGGGAPRAAHIEAALEDLKLLPKGGK